MKTIFIIASILILSTGVFAQKESVPFVLESEPTLVAPKDVTQHAGKLFPKLVFQEANIRAVLQFFAETGDVNFVIDPPVDAKVNLKLYDITWETGLTSILNTYELVITRDGNVFRVQNLEDYRQRITDARDYNKKQQELLPLETKIVVLNYADASNMTQVIQQAMSERGEIIVDSRTNSLIIKDIRETFPKIDSLTLALDTETPQIRVSAKIVNVDKNYIRQLGVQWGATGNNVQPYDQSVGIDVSPTTPPPMGSVRWGIVSGDYNINAEINAMVSDNVGEVVDNPEIVTLDNQEAKLKSGDQVPVSMLDEAGNIVTVYYNAGVELTVKPHVTSQNRVALDVKVTKNDYREGTSGQYIIIEREATTSCIVDNGGALVIGGISSKGVSKTNSGVPVLKDLPILGRLFRYDSTDKTDTELVIYITPHI
ncbi:MAG: secretin N-terminal domain-containing protein, partial [bacterium]